MSELDNPFSVTKATEFSDLEINEYWVTFNPRANISIDSILNPKEYMPKYLIGGKGCGKTHILRYFSFPLQKIKYNNNIDDLLQKDKYIGLYSVFHGLNSSRFFGKGITDDEWYSVFEYYFELYICDNLLHTIKEILELLNVGGEIEESLVQSILSIFSNYNEIRNVTTFAAIIELICDLRRKIDLEVLNAAFTRKLNYEDVKILFSPGDLLFGIPNCVSSCLENFKDVKFIYIFDEYEKLYEWQKKFVNTLVWDKKKPVTFWIGARRYGYTTRETQSGQEMKTGSEFQGVDLDFLIRSNEDLYKQFAEKLYLNRLQKYYEYKGLKVNVEELKNSFSCKFETYDENKILNEVIEKNRKKEYKHLRELRRKLSSGIKNGQALDLTDDSVIEEIIAAVTSSTNGNPLEQKYKLFYLYGLWYKADKNDTFNDILSTVDKEFNKFKKGEPSKFREIVDKRKKDLIAQLAKENDIKNTEYSGINEFIKISEGNPRSFILILKKTVEFAKIRGERPLEDIGKISLDAQFLAVYDTARWFYEDAELVGENGKNVYSSLRRLTDYFMLERFCDKPVETTVSCFYVKAEALSKNSIECIEAMKMHSILIEDESGRREKNSGRKERLFQINKVLAPLWNLPIAVRGSLSLSTEVAEAIFNQENSTRFEHLYKERKAQLNAPEFIKQSNNNAQISNFPLI